MAEKRKSIEEQYQHLDEISHILKRPGMFIGSTKYEIKQFFLYDHEQAQFVLRETEYVPSILKLCDEVISNSCDEFRRSTNMGLTEMSVTIDNNGSFTVRDNGGIPVVKHKTADMMLPDFLFGQLRTSSNYDDTEDRNVVGTNGLGNKLSAIFSKRFSIFTADGKKSFFHSWSENLRKPNDDAKVKMCKEHFTESHYEFDLSLFEDVSELSDDFVSIIEKRCIDAAAANTGLTVKFRHTHSGDIIRESEWSFAEFGEYISLFSDYVDINSGISYTDKTKMIWFFPDGSIDVGFVNGCECSRGTHVRAVHNIINETVANYIVAKKKMDVQPKNVEGKYSMFCQWTVSNPQYDSQTKECLTTPVSRFGGVDSSYEFSLPKKFTDDICKSDLIEVMVDWFKQKSDVEDQKTLRKLNKQAKTKIARNDKFIDANSKNVLDRELWIFEGDSAQAGFRMARNPQTQAAYMLRGVTLNTIDATASKVMSNKELADLVSIIGLQWGQRNVKENLNFNRIVIASDADHDGDKIAAILLVFFSKFPELFDYEMICRSISPIMICSKKNKEDIQIYTFAEYNERLKELTGYTVKYAKGLGSLNNDQYKQMMRHPRLHVYRRDEMADSTLHRWFGKGIARDRRSVLKNEV